MRIDRRVRLPMLPAPKVLGAAALIAAFAAGGGNVRGGGAGPTNPGAAAGTSAKASSLFVQRCARCHGDDGTGSGLRGTMGRLPNFANVHWQQQRSDAQLVVSILEGKGSRMPAFAGRLSRAEARALVGHIRSLAPPALVDTDASSALDFHERFRCFRKNSSVSVNNSTT